MSQQLMQPTPEVDERVPAGLTVTLTECVETVGVGLVPVERARRLLPPPYQLAGGGGPLTPLVALAIKARGIQIAGSSPAAGAFVQLGLLVDSLDGTGDVNTYLLWQYTSHAMLARSLQRFGVDAQLLPHLSYDVALEHGSSKVSVPLPGEPVLALSGEFSGPSRANGPLVANWWAAVERGQLRMQTSVSSILMTDAQLRLSTREDSALGRLIGADSLDLVAVHSFNTFAYARLNMRIVEPQDGASGR